MFEGGNAGESVSSVDDDLQLKSDDRSLVQGGTKGAGGKGREDEGREEGEGGGKTRRGAESRIDGLED